MNDVILVALQDLITHKCLIKFNLTEIMQKVLEIKDLKHNFVKWVQVYDFQIHIDIKNKSNENLLNVLDFSFLLDKFDNKITAQHQSNITKKHSVYYPDLYQYNKRLDYVDGRNTFQW